MLFRVRARSEVRGRRSPAQDGGVERQSAANAYQPDKGPDGAFKRKEGLWEETRTVCDAREEVRAGRTL